MGPSVHKQLPSSGALVKIADQNGAVIEGLVRNKNNGITVSDLPAYNKYIAEKQRIEKLHSLEKEVTEMKTTLSQILEILKENKR